MPIVGTFIATLLRLESFRYNYGRIWRSELVKDTMLRMPVTVPTDEPASVEDIDWEVIDRLMASLPYADVPALMTRNPPRPSRPWRIPPLQGGCAKFGDCPPGGAVRRPTQPMGCPE